MKTLGIIGFIITPRTIDNYIEKHGDELRKNGYAVLKGKALKTLKEMILESGVNETDFVNIKTPLFFQFPIGLKQKSNKTYLKELLKF